MPTKPDRSKSGTKNGFHPNSTKESVSATPSPRVPVRFRIMLQRCELSDAYPALFRDIYLRVVFIFHLIYTKRPLGDDIKFKLFSSYLRKTICFYLSICHQAVKIFTVKQNPLSDKNHLIFSNCNLAGGGTLQGKNEL
jgi:hypothetical protein